MIIKILKSNLMHLLRESILLDEVDLTIYSDPLESMIMDYVFLENTIEKIKLLPEDSEIAIVLDTGDLFSNHNSVNQVHLGLTVNDQGAASVNAYYVCDVKDRAKSNLVIVLDVPRTYYKISEFSKWLDVELGDALSHELQHSCDPTDMLSADIPEGEAKWESIENIDKHFTSDAETRGWVAGILGRSRKSGQNPYEILDDDLGNIFNHALSKGFSQDNLVPTMQRIYQKWKMRIDSKIGN